MTRIGHFQREAKLNLWLALLFFVVIPLLAIIVQMVVSQGADALRVDRCLDDGGNYIHETRECDFEKSHPGP